MEALEFQYIIEFKYEFDVPKKGCKRRTVNLYEVGSGEKNLLFSELEVGRGLPGHARSGIAGAINLLQNLLYENKGAYYLNDRRTFKRHKHNF